MIKYLPQYALSMPLPLTESLICSQQQRELRTLAAGSDLEANVETAQGYAQAVDRTRCDVRGFRTALIGSAQQCQKMAHLLDLDSGFAQSLAGAFSELEHQSIDIERILDSLFSQCARDLNVVQHIRSPSSTSGTDSAYG
jgi:hypothetical protein